MTSPKAYEVRHVNRNEIKEFIETWHYSHSINGLSATHCFGLYYKNVLIGGMIYGRLAMKGQSVKYQDTQVRDAVKAGIITETDADMTVIEMRRLACIDDTARNTESYFISRTLKWLKQHGHPHRGLICGHLLWSSGNHLSSREFPASRSNRSRQDNRMDSC